MVKILGDVFIKGSFVKRLQPNDLMIIQLNEILLG
jgi:hypothetical protein